MSFGSWTLIDDGIGGFHVKSDFYHAISEFPNCVNVRFHLDNQFCKK
jgi:hypothetical protein